MKSVFGCLRAPLVLAIFLLIFSFDAHAAIENRDMLDGIIDKIQNATHGMAVSLVGFATYLFWTLALIQLVIEGGNLALQKADIGAFFAMFVRFILTVGFFWWLLSNAVTGWNIAGTIIESMRDMAAQATGLGKGLSPSGIVDAGFDVLYSVYNSDLWLAEKILCYAVAIAILLVFAAVGVNMLMLLAESWFLLYGGIFILGFGGSRWTSDLAIGYYRRVLAVGFQLFGMAVVVGVGKVFVDNFMKDLSQNPDIIELAVMLIAAFVFFQLSSRIPAMLGSLVTGGGGVGGGPGGGGGGVSAAGMAGAALAGVAGVAALGMTAAGIAAGKAGAVADGAAAIKKAASAATKSLSSNSFTAGMSAFGRPSSGGGDISPPQPAPAAPSNDNAPGQNGGGSPVFDGNSLSAANDNKQADEQQSSFAEATMDMMQNTDTSVDTKSEVAQFVRKG